MDLQFDRMGLDWPQVRRIFEEGQAMLPTKIGDYRVISELGRGGMGVVYKALDEGGRALAIKVIYPELAEDNEFIKRFIREMQAVSSLDHPHIVKALDFGVDINQNIYFAALEFVDGCSLKAILQERSILPLDRALQITKEIALGLDYADGRGIIHRDIKPDNILIHRDGRAKIADFGLMKSAHQSSITQTGTILGTPHYLAPEQAVSDRNIDIRADIYSLGITLYHMLAGRPPFVAKNAMKIITAHCYKPLPSIFDFNPHVPEVVWDLILKMTVKDKEERLTPEEVIVWIERLQGQLAVGNVSSVLEAGSDGGRSVVEDEWYEESDELPTRMISVEGGNRVESSRSEVGGGCSSSPRRLSPLRRKTMQLPVVLRGGQEEVKGSWIFIFGLILVFCLLVVGGIFIFLR